MYAISYVGHAPEGLTQTLLVEDVADTYPATFAETRR